MLKEIKYLVFIIVIFLFLFMSAKYYFSDENKKILLIPLNKGIFVIYYESNDINFEFILS